MISYNHECNSSIIIFTFRYSIEISFKWMQSMRTSVENGSESSSNIIVILKKIYFLKLHLMAMQSYHFKFFRKSGNLPNFVWCLNKYYNASLLQTHETAKLSSYQKPVKP